MSSMQLPYEACNPKFRGTHLVPATHFKLGLPAAAALLRLQSAAHRHKGSVGEVEGAAVGVAEGFAEGVAEGDAEPFTTAVKAIRHVMKKTILNIFIVNWMRINFESRVVSPEIDKLSKIE